MHVSTALLPGTETLRLDGQGWGRPHVAGGSSSQGSGPLPWAPVTMFFFVFVPLPAPGLLPVLPRDLGSWSYEDLVVGWGKGGGAVFSSPAELGTQLLGAVVQS